MLFAANLWAALSTDFASLLGSRAVAGFAGGSTEALGAVIVNVRLCLLFTNYFLISAL